MNKLAEIQQKLTGKIPKSQFNKFGNFHYRSLEDILEHAKPVVNGLGGAISFADEMKELGGKSYIESTCQIYFSKDETYQNHACAFVPDAGGKKMDISQACGAASSYARKYAAQGLLGLDDQKDSDSNENTTTSGTIVTSVTKSNGCFTASLSNGEQVVIKGNNPQLINTVFNSYKNKTPIDPTDLKV